MSKRKRLALAYLFIPLWAWLVASQSVLAMEIVVATGVNDDPPYVFGDDEIVQENPGVTIEILRLIEASSDIQFTILKQPWKRVVSNIRDNKIDGGFHFSFKEKRKTFVAYPILDGEDSPSTQYSISKRAYYLYRLTGQTTHWNGHEIMGDVEGGLTIAAIRGGSITQDIKSLGNQLKEVSNDLQLIKLLLTKRVHAFVALENMLDPKIDHLAFDERIKIEKTALPMVRKDYYIGFSKEFYSNNQEAAWLVWNTIKEIKENGELEKIFGKYSQLQ